MKTKTIEVSRWVNIYPEPQGLYLDTEKSAKMVASPRCLATIELKGSYEMEVPERTITITESELREALGSFVLMPSYQERVDSVIAKVFGGEE